MNFLITVAFLLAAAGSHQQAGSEQDNADQTFRLESGDFVWMSLPVRHTPSEVDCRFEVTNGDPSIHVELLPMSEFRSFSRGGEHDTMALTPNGRTGEFRRVIDVRGEYRLVVKNKRGAPPATVSLHVRTKLDPGADVAQVLSPGRRLAVILISFGFFFITVAWSGRKLVRAMRT
jgi:hypothetical protein